MDKTTEYNKIIAEWMGGVHHIAPEWSYAKEVIVFPTEQHFLCCHSVTELKYHSSWDWIHPVWRKFDTEIELPYTYLAKYGGLCSKIADAILHNEGTPEIAAKLLAEAIQWLNTLKADV